ncbi:MAG: FHA domain-containing protein [Bifidobacteriaceae bacterium]|nr:FHA domain-containing protein [Bifidobacteriaceae bacterium]
MFGKKKAAVVPKNLKHGSAVLEMPFLPATFEPWASEALNLTDISSHIAANPLPAGDDAVPRGAANGATDGTTGGTTGATTGGATGTLTGADAPVGGNTPTVFPARSGSSAASGEGAAFGGIASEGSVSSSVDSAASTQPAVVPDVARLELRFSDGQHAPFSQRTLVGRRAPQPDDGYEAFVVLKDDTHQISRRHFEFGSTPMGRTWIMDLGSSNGTWLIHNGTSTQLEPRQRVSVMLGDSIRLGEASAVVARADAMPPSQPVTRGDARGNNGKEQVQQS